MSRPLSAQIDQLSLPAASAGEAERIAGAMQAALDRMFAADSDAGTEWRRSLDQVTVELPAGGSCEEMGATIARAVRDRLAITDEAR
jgi:hypothetical protein